MSKLLSGIRFFQGYQNLFGDVTRQRGERFAKRGFHGKQNGVGDILKQGLNSGKHFGSFEGLSQKRVASRVARSLGIERLVRTGRENQADVRTCLLDLTA